MPRTKKAEEAKPMKKTVKKEVVEAAMKVEKPQPKIDRPLDEKTVKGLSIEVFDVKGGKTTMTLPSEVFGVKINKTLLAQAVRVYLANQRAGSARAKTRGDVLSSTRKIYQQKGTGRARHGAVSAPIFVHGGVAHGPKLHDFNLSMPKKMRRQALFSALTTKKNDGSIAVIKGLETLEAKTKAIAAVLGKMGMEKGRNIMVVMPEVKEKAGNVAKAARNIAGVQLRSVTQLTAYEVLKTKTVLFMQDAIEGLKGEVK
jgi:large subunit ribosomal protein L4